MRCRLTKRTIDAIKPDPRRDIWAWDETLAGFGLRVKPTGVRTFVVQYRDGSRRTRRYAFGQYGALTPTQARQEARDLLSRIARGENPSEARKLAGLRGDVRKLAELYLERHARPRKKASSIAADEMNLRLHVLPRLGNLPVDAVTRADVTRLHHAMRATPGAANRVLALVSKMFSLAEAWGIRDPGTNPTRHVQRYKERKLERYLSPAELGRLGSALATFEREAGEGYTDKLAAKLQREARVTVAAIRLLVLTGARRDEILGLRWQHVDHERRCLRLPDSKTGAKVIPLNGPAMEVLEGLERSSEWVLPGRRGRLVNISKAWRRIREMAQLEDVRIHDLRHSFASVGAAGGQSLVVLGALLGHRQAATTSRYAHLSDDPVRAASEAIGSEIAAALKGQPDAPVVPIRGAGQ